MRSTTDDVVANDHMMSTQQNYPINSIATSELPDLLSNFTYQIFFYTLIYLAVHEAFGMTSLCTDDEVINNKYVFSPTHFTPGISGEQIVTSEFVDI